MHGERSTCADEQDIMREYALGERWEQMDQRHTMHHHHLSLKLQEGATELDGNGVASQAQHARFWFKGWKETRRSPTMLIHARSPSPQLYTMTLSPCVVASGVVVWFGVCFEARCRVWEKHEMYRNHLTTFELVGCINAGSKKNQQHHCTQHCMVSQLSSATTQHYK